MEEFVGAITCFEAIWAKDGRECQNKHHMYLCTGCHKEVPVIFSHQNGIWHWNCENKYNKYLGIVAENKKNCRCIEQARYVLGNCTMGYNLLALCEDCFRMCFMLTGQFTEDNVIDRTAGYFSQTIEIGTSTDRFRRPVICRPHVIRTKSARKG